MKPEIIIVHDIHKAIEDVGVMPYANTLVQEMGGGYFYVEADSYWEYNMPNPIPFGYRVVEQPQDDPRLLDKDGKTVKRLWVYRVRTVPNRLAWFIIDALRLKSQASFLGTGEHYEPGKQTVYLTKGTELFGHKVDQTTEIPAELGPVVVERL